MQIAPASQLPRALTIVQPVRTGDDIDMRATDYRLGSLNIGDSAGYSSIEAARSGLAEVTRGAATPAVAVLQTGGHFVARHLLADSGARNLAFETGTPFWKHGDVQVANSAIVALIDGARTWNVPSQD